MKKDIEKHDLNALMNKLGKLEKENKKLLEKIEKISLEKTELKKELKKNDVPKITMSKEQQRLLLDLSEGINTLSSSSD